MTPTIRQLCEAMAWTTEQLLLPEIHSTYARIQARELAKLLRWLGSVSDERVAIARAHSAALRRGLEPLAARLRRSADSEARLLAGAIDAQLKSVPDDAALAADAETSRQLQARIAALLPTLEDAEASELTADLHAAIAEDIAIELSAGPPAPSFQELTEEDLASTVTYQPTTEQNRSRR